MKIRYFRCVFSVLIVFGVVTANGQKWREIQPLITTCEDLKSILHIEACKYPVTFYADDSFWIHINFTDSSESSELKEKSCLPIPPKRVRSVSIRLIKGIYLRDFETDFADFSILAVPDLPDYLRLVNMKKGIDITLHNSSKVSSKSITDSFNSVSTGRKLFYDVSDELAIEGILIKPTAERSQKYCIR